MDFWQSILSQPPALNSGTGALGRGTGSLVGLLGEHPPVQLNLT